MALSTKRLAAIVLFASWWAIANTGLDYMVGERPVFDAWHVLGRLILSLVMGVIATSGRRAPEPELDPATLGGFPPATRRELRDHWSHQ